MDERGALELLTTLDTLACSLTDGGHIWTKEERLSYERAVRYLNNKDSK